MNDNESPAYLSARLALPSQTLGQGVAEAAGRLGQAASAAPEELEQPRYGLPVEDPPPPQPRSRCRCIARARRATRR